MDLKQKGEKMRIEFTRADASYACDELSFTFRKIVPEIITKTMRNYSRRNDERTLVIVLMCPCCNHDDLLDIKNGVLVSPFCGIDKSGYNISTIKKYPPFRNPGQDNECRDLAEFLTCFEETIKEALN